MAEDGSAGGQTIMGRRKNKIMINEMNSITWTKYTKTDEFWVNAIYLLDFGGYFCVGVFDIDSDDSIFWHIGDKLTHSMPTRYSLISKDI